MQYLNKSGQVVTEANFSQKVKEASGANLDHCYQCLTCSLGCPVTFAMDYLPNQLVRMVQLGLKQPVLTSSTIWVCANCEACVTRCPNDVDIPGLMNALREMALHEEVAPKERNIITFHQVFLGNIKQWGRQCELPMLLQCKLKTKDFFSDLGLGMKMLLKGKLKLFPSRSSGSTEVRVIFNKTKQRLAEGE